MIKEFKVKVEKLSDTTRWMKRAFALTVWMKKRYNLKFKQCTFTYDFREGDVENELVTTIFTFHD